MATMASSPWGRAPRETPVSASRKGGSLLDIMSEQLAQTLDAEERPETRTATTAAVMAAVPVVSATYDEDLDLALAAQLQEEENAYLYQQERHGPKGNVTVQYFQPAPLPRAQPNEEDEDEEQEQETPSKKKSPWRQRDKSLKGQGGDGEIITKHDAEISGRRNARKLEKFVPNCGSLGDTIVPNQTYNSFQHQLKKQQHADKGVVGRTVEVDSTRSKTLDSKTRLIIHRMLNAGVLDAVNYVVRTGKEGVIFHAVGPSSPVEVGSDPLPGRTPLPKLSSSPQTDNKLSSSPSDKTLRTLSSASKQQRRGRQQDAESSESEVEEDEVEVDEEEFLKETQPSRTTSPLSIEFAVKVYKTNLSEFSNRHEYVEGDHRFSSVGQLSRQNKQKIVKVWAEKELKNMTRMHRAGIPCPTPYRLDRNVLIMSFIGHDGWGAPQLADLDMGASQSRANKCFVQVLLLARALWDRCKLVHADLSEFNVLFQDGKCYIVDVGQAVERMHPNAVPFLRRDVFNVLTFFFNKCKKVGCGGNDEAVEQVCDWIMNGPPNVDEDVDANEWSIYAKEELGSWADYRLACKLGELLL